MGLSRAAATSLRWIRKTISWFTRNRAFVSIFGAMVPIEARKYLKELEKLERGIGAQTTFFPKVNAARGRIRAGQEEVTITLTADEIMYVYFFKKLWDKYVKRIFLKVGKLRQK